MEKATVSETHHSDGIDEKHVQLAEDVKQEHDLTLRQALTKYPSLAAWVMFWALCAIGWYGMESAIKWHR